MDRRAWGATVHGVTRVWHDWVTKQHNNPHTTHPFKVYNLVFLVHSQGSTPTTSIHFQNISITLKGNPVPIQQSLFILLRPWQPLIYFLSLWICQLWTLHLNGIMPYACFGVWLPSFSIIFSKFALHNFCNNSYWHRAHLEPGVVLSASSICSRLIIITIPWGGWWYYPHFLDEETRWGTKKLSDLPCITIVLAGQAGSAALLTGLLL